MPDEDVCARDDTTDAQVKTSREPYSDQKLRIVTLGISGGGSLTGPFRDTRRSPSTRWYSVPGAARTTLGFGVCPSIKAQFLSCQTLPRVTIRNFCIAVPRANTYSPSSRVNATTRMPHQRWPQTDAAILLPW
jgi:hypothetical protein